ncbi:ChuX/HutX family heme-like substrate-binding protein [Acerihabitans sp. TG2]|uniref:hemin-degrading factor n=1 Tax=Acerihabitans sp. TG2 TaxID=3096008 RepID=UPI002B234CE3|nr:ChuX/HutX family heme-like substrate-binding protein [Acerihabitans sp. TG2]MEA9391244.1 ChuX/HutX family heme-like substrate-binding protein [Acerihabitans sp. TG2]
MDACYQSYLTLKKQHPRKYARDLARLMNISEAELTHIRAGKQTIRLRVDVPAMLAALESVGETKSITRNAYAVHEQIGHYQNLELGDHAGLILNPRALDLRVFPRQWISAFHVQEPEEQGGRQSIQFFDLHGDAVLKIYTTFNTLMTAWEQWLACFAAKENPMLQLIPRPAAAQPTTAPPELAQEWRAMTDVHQFFTLLKRYSLTRQQAFRAVPDDLAYRVDNQALRQILAAARRDGNEIMIFVGNRGCVQIFTGVIEKVTPWQNWLNIFNRDFTLHLVEDTIAESWVTCKPTLDGNVTSLELFAANGTPIAQLFGQRTEGQPEQKQWRAQIAQLSA